MAGPLALVGANLFVVFFGMSWGPVVWVLLGEMFNNRIRAIALAVAAAAQWLANFVVTASFPMLKGINVALPYLLFTIFAILSFFFVLKFALLALLALLPVVAMRPPRGCRAADREFRRAAVRRMTCW